MTWRHGEEQRGFVLMPVVLALSLIATIAFLLNRETALDVELATASAQGDVAHYVAEAGLQHEIWRINQENCSGYTNLPATPFGNHSYSATVIPSDGSPVKITATGVLASGATRTYARHNVRIFGASVTVVLQPGPEGKDTFILEEKPDENRGEHNDLSTDSEAAGKGPVRALIEFDLSSIPPGVIIQSAELSLYMHSESGSADVVEAHRLEKNWIEGVGGSSGATWNTRNGGEAWTTPGGDYAAEVEGTFVASGTGWKTLSLTNLTQAWLDGAYPNYGVILLSPPNSGNNEKKYHSSDQASTERPKLTVTYLAECGAGASSSVTATLPSVADTYIDGGQSHGSEAEVMVGRPPRVGDVISSFSAPGTRPQGLTWDGTNLWLADSSTDLLYQLTTTGTVLSSFDTEGPAPTGLTWDGTNLWLADSSTDLLYQLTTTGTVLSSFVPPHPDPQGLTWDGVNLWVNQVNTGGNAYYIYQLTTGGAVVSSFPGISNGEPFGMAWDGTNLWINYRAGRVWETTTTGIRLGWFAQPCSANKASGLTFDGTNFWLACDGNGPSNNIIYQLAGPALAPVYALLRFDVLTTIPAGATIQSALLRLYEFAENGSQSYLVGAHRITQAWTEAGANWPTADGVTPWSSGAGGSYDPVAVDSTTVNTSPGWREWDLTPLVQEWVDGVSTDYGVQLIHGAVPDGNRAEFHSREGVAGNLPELVVTYTP